MKPSRTHKITIADGSGRVATVQGSIPPYIRLGDEYFRYEPITRSEMGYVRVDAKDIPR